MPSLLSQIEHVPADSLEFYPGNPRRGNVQVIAASLKENQQYAPLVVQRSTRYVLAGNHTLKAAISLGWNEIDVVFVDVDDARARKILLSSNRTAELPGPEGFRYDDDALAELLSYLDEDYEGTGWTAEDVEALITPPDDFPPGGGGGDPDDVPELPAESSTVPGDLFRLGDHVLLCGDSTKRADVARLMDGERAPIMVTDPPYGVAYHANKKGAKAASIAGDLTQAAIPLGFAVAVELALDDDARVYLFGGTANWPMYSSLFDHHLRMQPRPMIWVKEGFVLHPTHYHSQYETVFFGWKGKGGGAVHWYGDRKQSDVWTVSRDPDRVHPTQKPVEVCAIPIRHSAPPGALVYEPFGGSGSTLIAAHMLRRRARVMELDPKFCDVILRRFERFAEIKPERVLEDGTTVPVSFT